MEEKLWGFWENCGGGIFGWSFGDSESGGLVGAGCIYYVCKSSHHQGIDKSALHDHLGGYLGEYVPLKSSTQKENLDA
ncbi:hypothetical protein CRYUN_Cryun18bG0141900 [Craigia yunnanensis]